MPVQRGDVYWVDFGTPRGSQQGGRRPALIIQNDTGNRSSPTTLVAAITSQQKKSYPFHVDFSAEESGLSRNGTVLLEQIRTVNQNMLVNKAGELSSAKMAAVDQALKVSMGLI